jgi:hypothetical protein
MNFNGRNFGKTDELIRSPFVQVWEDSNINPPPPMTSIMITESGQIMITELTLQRMITE